MDKRISSDKIKQLLLGGASIESIANVWNYSIWELEKIRNELQSQQDITFMYKFQEMIRNYNRLYVAIHVSELELLKNNENLLVNDNIKKMIVFENAILSIDMEITKSKEQLVDFRLRSDALNSEEIAKKKEIEKNLYEMRLSTTKNLSSLVNLMENVKKQKMSILQYEEIIKICMLKKKNNDLVVKNAFLLKKYKYLISCLVEKMAQEINNVILDISDINLLNQLKDDLLILDNYSVIVQSVLLKLVKKIDNISKKNPNKSNIDEIVKLLVKGDFDINQVNALINKEQNDCKNNVGKFTFSDENEVVLTKIKYGLKYTNYTIENPNLLLNQLTKFFDCSAKELVPIIVKNLILHSQYEEARSFVDYFSCNDENFAKNRNYYVGLEKEIIGAEIGECVKKAFSKVGKDGLSKFYLEQSFSNEKANSDDSYLDESRFMQLIYRKLNSFSIDPSLISLGLTEDGSKIITLRDILPNNLERELYR